MFCKNTLLLLSTAIGVIACSSDPVEESPEYHEDGGTLDVVDTDNETLDMGDSLSFDGIDHFEVSYFESAEGVCESPHDAYIVVADNLHYPQIVIIVPFWDTPSGEFRVGDSVAGIDGRGEDNASNSFVYIYFNESEKISYIANSGVITIDVDSVLGVVDLTLSEVTFADYGEEGTVYGGSVKLDLFVYCSTVEGSVPPEGNTEVGCGWLTETLPYSSTFCQEIAKSYTEDVLR